MGLTIICGVQDEQEAHRPLRLAADLANHLDRRLVLAHVLSPDAVAPSHPPSGGGLAPAVPYSGPEVLDTEAAAEHHRAATERLERLRADLGLDADVWVDVAPDAAEGLRQAARERQSELVVVGSRGRGAAAAAFLGSTSHSLAGEAPCPVVVVPPTD